MKFNLQETFLFSETSTVYFQLFSLQPRELPVLSPSTHNCSSHLPSNALYYHEQNSPESAIAGFDTPVTIREDCNVRSDAMLIYLVTVLLQIFGTAQNVQICYFNNDKDPLDLHSI